MTPTPDMLRAGALVLRADFPDLSARGAETWAGEIFAAMIDAAPKKVDVQPKPAVTLTPRQNAHHNLLWDLADELGRYPTSRELAHAAGTTQQSAQRRIGFLREKGFVKVNRKGRIRWLKPRQ